MSLSRGFSFFVHRRGTSLWVPYPRGCHLMTFNTGGHGDPPLHMVVHSATGSSINTTTLECVITRLDTAAVPSD